MDNWEMNLLFSNPLLSEVFLGWLFGLEYISPNILYTLFKYKDEDVFQSLIYFFLDFGIASVSGGFKGLIFTKFFTNSMENE